MLEESDDNKEFGRNSCQLEQWMENEAWNREGLDTFNPTVLILGERHGRTQLKPRNEQNNSQWTKVIFHGKNYENTKNAIDFMKYNFDFIIDEQYKSKKLITDCSLQHVDIKNINGNANIYENYNVSEQHLDEIKNKWSREKFLGDDDELKNAIDTIKDGFNERKTYSNEEKYLDIIKNNNYNVDAYDNSKKYI